jgi:hypothetical protein
MTVSIASKNVVKFKYLGIVVKKIKITSVKLGED